MNNVINQTVENRYAAYHGDCVEITRNIPDNSIHYTIFSPLYIHILILIETWGIVRVMMSFIITFLILQRNCIELQCQEDY